MFIFILSVVSICAIGLLACCRFSKNHHKDPEKWMKVLAVALVVLSFLDIFLPDAFSLRFIWDFEYLKEHHNPFHAILRAFNALAVITLPVAVFFRKEQFARVVSFVLLPATIVNIACYQQYISYFTSDLTSYAPVFGEKLRPFLTNEVFRSVIFGILMELTLVLSVYVLLFNWDHLHFRSGKEVMTFIVLLLALLVSNMPIYTIQQITGGTTDITFNMGDPAHFAYIAALVIEGIVLTLIFRRQSDENKYILLLVMSISLLFQYNTFFKTDGNITATRYPLQLCNIAGAFLITTLLTRSEKMFHFTVVVNVTGAIIAIALCDSTKDVGVLYCMNIHYMTEHANVLLVPILGLTLGVFKPLEKRDYKDFTVGFALYYLFVLLCGTVLNGLAAKTGNGYFTCNYLFMFQKDAAVRLVGNFVGSLFDKQITLFGYYHLYLAQIAVYAAFMLICTLIFFGLYAAFGRKKHEKKQPA